MHISHLAPLRCPEPSSLGLRSATGRDHGPTKSTAVQWLGTWDFAGWRERLNGHRRTSVARLCPRLCPRVCLRVCLNGFTVRPHEGQQGALERDRVRALGLALDRPNPRSSSAGKVSNATAVTQRRPFSCAAATHGGCSGSPGRTGCRPRRTRRPPQAPVRS